MKGFRSVINLHLIVYLEIFKAENDVYFFLCSKDTSEADDPTVSYNGDQPVPEILSPNPQEDLIDSCVGPRNIPGYDRVVALAEFLVTLKDCPGALTHLQASEIINLWKRLSDYDKTAISFPPRSRKI